LRNFKYIIVNTYLDLGDVLVGTNEPGELNPVQGVEFVDLRVKGGQAESCRLVEYLKP
jgi:hypothetical protein